MNTQIRIVLKEISNELNWREKIIMHVFRRYTYKVYNICRIRTINSSLK